MKGNTLGNAQISIRPRTLAYGLAIAGVLVVAAAAFAHIFRHQIIVDLEDPRADILRRLDLVEEPSLTQWFSSSLHLSTAFLLLLIGLSVGRPMYWRWLGLSVLFIYASIDEAIMIHEMMDRPTREFLNTSGFLAIAWIIPGAFIAMLIGLGYLSFLKSLSPRIAKLFVAGGVTFLSGAILMEIPGGYLYEKYGFASWHYIVSYALEELLEILGIITFINGLLSFIEESTRDQAGVSQAFYIQISDCSNASTEA